MDSNSESELSVMSPSCVPRASNFSALRICRYDVFLSFRGIDIRNTFIDHLYANLVRKGIFVFKDDQSLEKGETISSQLLEAIKDSRISIVVFSEKYAESRWCLDEMAIIAECHRILKQIVFPVFYYVDPSHVRNQSGVYKDAFISHTERFKHDTGKVDRWKRAMRDLGNLAGWDLSQKPEFEEISNIVEEVIETLRHKFSQLADDLIGIQPCVKELESLLKLSSEGDGFRVLGIWGMGGIGKTTLATVLYDRISYQFEACCFIENVTKIFKDGGGVIAVQKQILRQTIDEKNLETYSPTEISRIISNRLQNIKVLVVLDNVDQVEQLQQLHINPKSLPSGSRIIITTRDEHILRVYEADIVYEAQLMNDNDACELLCRKAFKSNCSSSTYAKMIPEVLKYAQGLPLAIRVLGSFLCTRDATQWKATLKRLKNSSDNEILEVLQISFEGLHSDEKEIFLHIACFFKGQREDYVRRILDCCGLNPDIGIPIIMEKSLITIRNQEIHMHEMLQKLGKQIVWGQHPNEPGFWSRLWLFEHFHHVMMTKMETDNVKAIVLDQKEDGFELRAEDLSKMRGLRMLILDHKNFSGSLTFLSNFLLYLSWNGYPFTSLPSDFKPYGLVELNMPDSSIERLWEDAKEPRHFRCGFDTIVPWDWENTNFPIPGWFDHQFGSGSIIRIVQYNVDGNWLGFAFCVAFEVNNRLANSGSPHDSISLSLPHPFYLSFESEYTEERFDMPLRLELDKIDGSKHLWVIYISPEHCHFVKTGACITFKAFPGLMIKKWGLRMLIKKADVDQEYELDCNVLTFFNDFIESDAHRLVFDYIEESSNYGPKIQLPYNWFVTEEEKAENSEAKTKEDDLSNLGL